MTPLLTASIHGVAYSIRENMHLTSSLRHLSYSIRPTENNYVTSSCLSLWILLWLYNRLQLSGWMRVKG